MDKKYFVLPVVVALAACSSTVAVRPLESTIRDAVIVAKRSTDGAAKEVKIEVSVTYGTKIGGTIPIPVVPIDASSSATSSTKLTLIVDLSKVNVDSKYLGAKTILPADGEVPPGEIVYILDTKTGFMKAVKQN